MKMKTGTQSLLSTQWITVNPRAWKRSILPPSDHNSDCVLSIIDIRKVTRIHHSALFEDIERKIVFPSGEGCSASGLLPSGSNPKVPSSRQTHDLMSNLSKTTRTMGSSILLSKQTAFVNGHPGVKGALACHESWIL
ncbi:hypothetical protein AVEN_186243-1 [Araneus ventricosus]|uniref:Uncharacterized protein n=1 Tax=Araneus ventricosus TaxID=182803 RepID=A0A4Y2NHS3_ARAVE|nr:hypothetical protein AVEN_186243-1 [Araneus ventricosus]